MMIYTLTRDDMPNRKRLGYRKKHAEACFFLELVVRFELTTC